MPSYRDPNTMHQNQQQGVPTISKHPFVAKQRIKADMSESQKQGIAVWNSMVSFLESNGLMEERK